MVKITKAVIACAGWGTRFLPAAKTYAKHLVPILNKPQIEYVLEELIGAGITHACIVHRHGEKTLKNHFKANPELNHYLKTNHKASVLDSLTTINQKLKIKFIPQPRSLPYGNGTPILAAKSFIGSDPFVYLWGDDLTIENKPGAFLSRLINTFKKYKPDIITSVIKQSPQTIQHTAAVAYKKDPLYPYRISDIIEKPALGTAPSLFSQGARFIVSPNIIPVLENQAVSKGELWFTNAEATLAKTGIVLAVPYKKASWMATGDPLNWLKANITLALRHPDYQKDLKTFLGSLN